MPDKDYEATESNVEEFFPTGNGSDTPSLTAESEDSSTDDTDPQDVESGTPKDAEPDEQSEPEPDQPVKAEEAAEKPAEDEAQEPTITVDGEKLTVAEVEKRLKAAKSSEEWQANGTRRAMQAAEDRKAAEASRTELIETKVKLAERELKDLEAERPIEPERPERPDASDPKYLNDEDAYEAAKAQYESELEAYKSAKREHPGKEDEWREKREAARRQIEELRTSTPSKKETTAQPETVDQEMRSFLDAQVSTNNLTQGEVDRIWPKVLEAQATNTNRHQVDILRQLLYEEVYPARAQRVEEVSQDVAKSLRTRQEVAANASPGAQPTQSTESGKTKTIFDVDDPDSTEAKEMLEKLVRDHPNDWYEKLNEIRNQRVAAS